MIIRVWGRIVSSHLGLGRGVLYSWDQGSGGNSECSFDRKKNGLKAQWLLRLGFRPQSFRRVSVPSSSREVRGRSEASSRSRAAGSRGFGVSGLWGLRVFEGVGFRATGLGLMLAIGSSTSV